MTQAEVMRGLRRAAEGMEHVVRVEIEDEDILMILTDEDEEYECQVGRVNETTVVGR